MFQIGDTVKFNKNCITHFNKKCIIYSELNLSNKKDSLKTFWVIFEDNKEIDYIDKEKGDIIFNESMFVNSRMLLIEKNIYKKSNLKLRLNMISTLFSHIKTIFKN